MSGAAERERAYVADVAHDLQSPLDGHADPARGRHRALRLSGAEAWLRAMLAATTEMELLVGDLLASGRPRNARGQPVPRELVDLDALVREEAETTPPETEGVDRRHSRWHRMKVHGDDTSAETVGPQPLGQRRPARRLPGRVSSWRPTRPGLRPRGDRRRRRASQELAPGADLRPVLPGGPARLRAPDSALAIVRQVAERHDGHVGDAARLPGRGRPLPGRAPDSRLTHAQP